MDVVALEGHLRTAALFVERQTARRFSRETSTVTLWMANGAVALSTLVSGVVLSNYMFSMIRLPFVFVLPVLLVLGSAIYVRDGLLRAAAAVLDGRDGTVSVEIRMRALAMAVSGAVLFSASLHWATVLALAVAALLSSTTAAMSILPIAKPTTRGQQDTLRHAMIHRPGLLRRTWLRVAALARGDAGGVKRGRWKRPAPPASIGHPGRPRPNPPARPVSRQSRE